MKVNYFPILNHPEFLRFSHFFSHIQEKTYSDDHLMCGLVTGRKSDQLNLLDENHEQIWWYFTKNKTSGLATKNSHAP